MAHRRGRALLACTLGLLAACNSTPPEQGSGNILGTAGQPAAQAGATAGAAGMTSATGTAGSSIAAAGGGGSTAQPTAGLGAAGADGAQAGAAGADGAAGSAGGGGAAVETCQKDLEPKPEDDDCTAPLKPNTDRLCKFSHDGSQRQFYIYAPPSYDPCKPASMIMDCHGLSESAEVHTGKEGFNLSGQQYPKGYGSSWRLVVQGDNAIVVTPQGVGDSWSTSTDVPFLNAIGDMIEKIADVDPEKEYVTGISMGGMMTVATGCDDSDRWRGMAPVAMLSQSCRSIKRPIPMISFHAMSDQLTSYADDRSNAQAVADFNHCMNGPTPAMTFGGPNTDQDPFCFEGPNGVGDPDAPDPYTIPLVPCKTTVPESSCVRWDQCDEGVEVVFCTVAAASQPIGGHILYNNDTQLAPAAVAWPFFKKFWK